eukprot:scaffold374_cov108-Isochrysis_galbana.AAC.8
MPGRRPARMGGFLSRSCAKSARRFVAAASSSVTRVCKASRPDRSSATCAGAGTAGRQPRPNVTGCMCRARTLPNLC